MSSLLIVSLALLAAPPDKAADAAAIEKVVLDAQRAGFERHDFEKYMAQWASDAKLVLGRSEKPGKHDIECDRDQIESSRRFLFHGKPQSTLAFENVRVDVEGDEGELRVRRTTSYDGGSMSVQERYRVRRTIDGWEVFENRAWPIVHQHKAAAWMELDADAWKKREAYVDWARTEHSSVVVGHALASAFRFSEAFALAKKLTESETATAEEWLLRGFMAIQTGMTEDAITSFEKARTLDPDVELPEFARVYLDKKEDP